MSINTFIPGILTLLTLFTHVLLILFTLLSVASPFISKSAVVTGSIRRWISPYARILAFTVALTATSGSLFYSEVLQYQPCILCWYQRIFMYPQTLLIALGILKNDKNIADYSIGLSIAGGAIAAFHYWGQVVNTAMLPCSVTGLTSSCSTRFTMEYGYITIPLMSLTAYVLIIILMLLTKKKSLEKAD